MRTTRRIPRAGRTDQIPTRSGLRRQKRASANRGETRRRSPGHPRSSTRCHQLPLSLAPARSSPRPRGLEDAVSFVLERATVGAGDSAWKIWDVREIADAFPPYWPTLVSAVGGRFASVFGLFFRREGYDEWYAYDFSALATLVTKEYAGTVEA